MTESGHRTRLLIVGDNQFDIEETIRLSSSLDVQIEQALDSEWAVEQFDRDPAHILILCHSKVEHAHKFYLSFLMFSKVAMDTPHQTILMCDGKEAQLAYELSSGKTLDDYVVYKPLFDIHRLKFSIVQAVDRLHHVNYKRLMEQRLASMMEEIKAVKKALKEQVQKTHRYQQEAKDNDDALEDIIREGFDRVKGKLDELNHDGSIKIQDSSKVDKVYNTFQKEELDKVKDQQNTATLKRDAWIEEMRQDFSINNQTQTDTVTAVIDDSKRVLIVEDELVNQKMMAMILQAEGFKVQVASDGISAIAVAEKWQPHVILMDIRMPKMNGLKVTQKLKSNPLYKETIIIMLTAHSEKVVVRECLKSGAADFIVKPAKKAELLERIEHFLSGGD